MPVLWPFTPTSVEERMVFNTNVRRAYAGEYRDGLRDAVQIMTHSLTREDQEAASMELLYRTQPLGEWYVPLWHDGTRYKNSISPGETVFTVETDADYRAGGQVAFIYDYQTAEVVDVVSATGGTLTIAASPGLTLNYPGTNSDPVMICPVVTALAPEGFNRSDRPVVGDMGITFYSIEPLDLADTLYPTFGLYDAVDDPSVVINPISGVSLQNNEFEVQAVGSFFLEDLEDRIRKTSRYSVLKTSYADRWAIRKWLHRIRGRDRPFWLPSWKADFRVTSASSGTSVVIADPSPVSTTDVEGLNLNFYNEVTKQSTRLTVSSVIDNLNGNWTLLLSGSVTVDEETPVSIMRLVRFNTDEILISHRVTQEGFITTYEASVIETLE